MNKSRRVLEGGIVTAALAITTVATAVSGNVKDTSQSSKQANNEAVFLAGHNTAGNAEEKIAVAADKSDTQQAIINNSEKKLVTAEFETVKQSDGASENEMDAGNALEADDIQGEVADSMFFAVQQKAVVEDHLDTGAAQKPQQNQEEKSEWDKRLMADVEDNLNVRSEASEESEVIGKLYKGSAAEVVETGDSWSKIKSGNVEGYVKNEFCVFGDEAETLADKVCTTYAKSTAEGLRVREKADTDSKVFTVLNKGEKLTVDKKAEEAEGWVAVKYNGKTAYISDDYSEVSQQIGKAMTLEEEQKMIEKQEAKKRAAEAAEQKQLQASQGSGTSVKTVSVKKGTGVSSSVDDVTLLAALIYCEAGAEPYAGKLAVGAVVVNRVQSSAYPNTISGVIYQRGQFGPASSGKLAKILAKGAPDSCYKAAREALSGVDNTGGAIGFHAGKGSGTVIGNQTFF